MVRGRYKKHNLWYLGEVDSRDKFCAWRHTYLSHKTLESLLMTTILLVKDYRNTNDIHREKHMSNVTVRLSIVPQPLFNPFKSLQISCDEFQFFPYSRFYYQYGRKYTS